MTKKKCPSQISWSKVPIVERRERNPQSTFDFPSSLSLIVTTPKSNEKDLKPSRETLLETQEKPHFSLAPVFVSEGPICFYTMG